MARIRTIKPEFWTDEKLAPLPPLVRLVFLGLVSQADDAGRLLDNVKLLDGLLFPETDDTCREALDILARLSRIVRYTSESGQRLIQITNWDKHQRVDKPSKAVLPPPPPEVVVPQRAWRDSRDTREELATPSRDTRAPSLDHGPGIMEGDHHPSSGAGANGEEQSIEEEPPAPAAADDRETAITSIIDAANHGLCTNGALDQVRLQLLPKHSDSKQEVTAWIEEGIPISVIIRVVEQKARGYKPNAFNGQPSNMRYFAPAVREAWAKQQGTNRGGNGNGKRRDTRRPAAEGRSDQADAGTARPGKYEHLVERSA